MMDVTDSSAQSGAHGVLVTRLLAWRPLESWQTVLAAGIAVLVAATLSLFVVGGDPASAPTYVTSAHAAAIDLPDGSSVLATIGARLDNGAILRTLTRDGSARLTTDGRDVYVGGLSNVVVRDGVHQVLERGLVMIDTRSGPPLTLETRIGAGTVTVPQGALARVEQNVATLRLGAYEGAPTITAAERSASATVPPLHQVRIPYGGVPEPATALALTVKDGVYDRWEQRLVAHLVQADVDLNSFATGLNGVDGVYVLNAAPASLRTTNLIGRTRGEHALAVAVAQTARLHRDVRANLAQVERDRGDGGSWGVVAAIVQARVTDVTSVLGSSLDDPGSVNGTLAGGLLDDGSGFPGGSSPEATGTGGSGGGGGATPTPTVSPHGPTPTKGPVEEAIEEVGKLLPTPAPTPTPTPTPSPSRSGAQETLESIITKLLEPLPRLP